MQNLKARLIGVVIEKALEPSYALLDAVAQQWEAKQLAYLSPEKCTSREWEITMSKTSKQLSIDSDKLLVKSEQSVPDQQVSTEMQVYEALRRRGIALAFTDSLTWEVHERYLQRRFQHMRNDAPEGYAKTTLQQVLRVDRDVFLHMVQRDVSMRRAPDNTLPMDTAILEAVSSYEVGFSLMPLPKKIERPEPKASAAAPSYGNWPQGRRNTKRLLEPVRSAAMTKVARHLQACANLQRPQALRYFYLSGGPRQNCCPNPTGVGMLLPCSFPQRSQ